MKSVSLNAVPRNLVQRNAVKKLRTTSRIPAVIYGRHHPPQNLEITELDFQKLVHQSISENILVDLEVAGDANPKRLALVQEVQHHALSGRVLHVDLHEVAEDEKVTVTVPVETFGEAAGVKSSGGILEHILFKLKVRGLPKDLPEVIKVDVSALEVGQAIHIGEIAAPAGTELIGDKKITVVAVAAPVTEAEEAAEAAAATEGLAEPEVLKEKKGEEGEAGTAAPAKAGEKGAEKASAEKKPAEKGAEKKPAEKAPEKKAEKKK
jgi:large subunit ribosomal protein L25